MTGGFTKVQDDPPFPMYILKTGIRVNQVFLLYVIDELIEFHEKNAVKMDSIHGFLQLKTDLLTVMLWSQL